MWNTERFGAVSSRGRQAAPSPSIFSSSESLYRRRTSHLGLIGGLVLNGFYEQFRPFLPGTASQVECDVTHSKQRFGQFLPGATTAHQRSSNWRKFPTEFVHGSRRDERWFAEFLSGSASQTECDVTLSKQTTEKFLTGARIPFSKHQVGQDFPRNLTRGTRVALHGSRRLPATSHSPLATAFRYNAPSPNFPREACNLN